MGKDSRTGDVSPGNVLFTGQGKPMLSDLGIARMLGDPAGGAGHGTPGFVDPAPVDAVRAGLQPERDVYAAAALGWFCLTGAAPPRTADRPPLPLLVPVFLLNSLQPWKQASTKTAGSVQPPAPWQPLSTAVPPLCRWTFPPPSIPPSLPELLTRRHVPPTLPGRG